MPAPGRIVRRCLLRAGEVRNKKRWLLAGNFINRAVRVRHDKHIAVRRRLDISRDSEVAANQQATRFP